MLLSRKYLVLILVSAIVLHQVAGEPADKESESKGMMATMKDYMSKAMDYVKKMATSWSGGASKKITGA
uniref:Putative secreted protein n=1 Tax=Ixodes ricinus TaxID=34613 RepID=A0A147BLR4_IXORI